jgi:DnaK suppressor protein
MTLPPEFIAEAREILERQRARLERGRKLSEEATRTVELDQQAVGRLARMDSLQNQAIGESLKERQEVQFNATVAALARIEDGGYGTCVGCGGAIDPGRLLVLPEVESCGACEGRSGPGG